MLNMAPAQNFYKFYQYLLHLPKRKDSTLEVTQPLDDSMRHLPMNIDYCIFYEFILAAFVGLDLKNTEKTQKHFIFTFIFYFLPF